MHLLVADDKLEEVLVLVFIVELVVFMLTVDEVCGAEEDILCDVFEEEEAPLVEVHLVHVVLCVDDNTLVVEMTGFVDAVLLLITVLFVVAMVEGCLLEVDSLGDGKVPHQTPR
jgi:hypothetical protein